HAVRNVIEANAITWTDLMKRSRKIVEVADTRMPRADRARSAWVSVGRDPASDQERVLEQDERRAFARWTVSLRSPVQTNDGRQDDGSGRKENSESDGRRQVATGRSS